MLASWQTLKSAMRFLPWSPLPLWQLCCCKQLPSNESVPASYIDSHGTDFSLCRKGNDIQTCEVGSLGLLMTPSFGILFFPYVYSALSYSCILHNKIIYSSVVLCLLVLHSYVRGKRRKELFPLCRLQSFQLLLPGVSNSQGKAGVPVAISNCWAHEERAVIFTTLICITWVSEEYDPTTENCCYCLKQ